MIYPETDSRTWSIRHNLELELVPCLKCKKLIDVNIPIISKDFVGFESEVHECGKEYKIILLKPRSLEVQNLILDTD